MTGFAFFIAFPNSKLPPIAKSANGVAILAKFPMVLSIILGNCTFVADKITPAKILKIIGFVTIPFKVVSKVLS